MTDHTTAERAAFEANCAALPEGVSWGDALTPAIVSHIRASISEAALPMPPLTGPDALLIGRVFAQFRKDACLPGDDRISESFIKAAGALMGERAESVDRIPFWHAAHWPTPETTLTTTHIKDRTVPIALTDDDIFEIVARELSGDSEDLRNGFVIHAEPNDWIKVVRAAQSEPATRAVPVAMSDEKILALSLKHIPPYESTDEQVVRFARALLAAIPSDSAAPTPDAERHVANHAGDLVPVGWMYDCVVEKHFNTKRLDYFYSLDGGETYVKGVPVYLAQPTDKEMNRD